MARAVQRLGGRADAVWLCGGHVGAYLSELLDSERLYHHPIAIEQPTRENLIVCEQASGQQYRFGMPGPVLSQAEVARVLEHLPQCQPPPDYLVLSGSLPRGVDPAIYAHIAAAADPQTRVVLDTSAAALAEGLRAGVYLIKPNLRELALFAGRDMEHEADIRSAARELIELGRAEVVLASLGSAGAVIVTADQYEHIRAPMVKIRSKVGAGDSMVAGAILALAQGKSVYEAACWGVAAGAAAVMTPGTELCRRSDAERLHADIVRAGSPG